MCKELKKYNIKLYEVVCNNHMSAQVELVALDNKLKIHQRHLQFLAIAMYTSKNKLYPGIMWKTYKEKNIPYLLRKGIFLFISIANIQKYGINSLNFRGSVLQNNLPIKSKQGPYIKGTWLKECKSLQEFKLLLKKSGNLPCICSACKA